MSCPDINITEDVFAGLFKLLSYLDKEFLNYEEEGRFINSLFYQQKLGINHVLPSCSKQLAFYYRWRAMTVENFIIGLFKPANSASQNDILRWLSSNTTVLDSSAPEFVMRPS